MALTKATYAMIEGTPINVLDYGADPSGVADSTAAINAAIAAGSYIYIPQGTYRITSPLVLGDGKRIVGAGVRTTLNLASNTKLIDNTYGFILNNISILLQPSQTETVIKLDANRGVAYQMNNIDLSGVTIYGNAADCVAIHFKVTNNSYMAYNNMRDIAVVAEGVRKACILFEVDDSSSYIQGNTFSNLNLIRGGIRYVYDGTPNNATLMIGNYFDGTYQTSNNPLLGQPEVFELCGINNAIVWDSSGYRNLNFLSPYIGLNWGNSFYELIGNDEWGTLEPDIFVHDGWAVNVEKYKLLATGTILPSLSTESKAQRGRKAILDPCFSSLDSRWTLTGMSETGTVISVGDSRRSAVTLSNTVDLANTSQLILNNTACTISKFPEFKIAVQKDIDGFYGAGTPVAWNPRLDARIGLISSDGQNGFYAKIVAISGNVGESTISLCYLVAGVETVLDSSQVLGQNSSLYLSMYVDNTNLYMKATVVLFNNQTGMLIAENPSYGQTSGWKSVARSSLFNVNTVTLNPQLTLTSTDKEVGRAKYHVYGIEFECADL